VLRVFGFFDVVFGSPGSSVPPCHKEWDASGRRRTLLYDGVKNAHLLPAVFVFSMKRIWAGRLLIYVVGAFIGEHDVQGHVEAEIVYVASQVGRQFRRRRKRGCRDEPSGECGTPGSGGRGPGCGTVVQREKDIMGQHHGQTASRFGQVGDYSLGTATAAVRQAPTGPGERRRVCI